MRRALAPSTLAFGVAAGVAAACGPRDASDAAGRAADRPAVNDWAADAVLPPGAYRMRARGVNVYRDTFPMAGVLRIDPARPRYANATLALDAGPDGFSPGRYEGRVAAGADTAVVTLTCEHCRIPTSYGGTYAALTTAGTYRVRALGGGRYELTERRAPGDPARPAVDTLVRVDR